MRLEAQSSDGVVETKGELGRASERPKFLKRTFTGRALRSLPTLSGAVAAAAIDLIALAAVLHTHLDPARYSQVSVI